MEAFSKIERSFRKNSCSKKKQFKSPKKSDKRERVNREVKECFKQNRKNV